MISVIVGIIFTSLSQLKIVNFRLKLLLSCCEYFSLETARVVKIFKKSPQRFERSKKLARILFYIISCYSKLTHLRM